MKINFKFLISLCFILTFSIRGLTDAIMVHNNDSNFFLNSIKYVFFFIDILLSIFYILFNKIKLVNLKKFIFIFMVPLIFLIFSLIQMLIVNKVQTIFLVELSYIVLAIVFAYLLTNILNTKEIYNCMCIILIAVFLGYIYEIGITNFSINNIFNSNFSLSTSVFESSTSSGTAFVLCGFFLYYNKNKFFTILSLIFVLLTFKRVFMVVTLFIFIEFCFLNKNKKIKSKYFYLFPVLFILSTVVYFNILTYSFNDLIIYNKLMDFTQSRVLFLKNLIYSNEKIFGFGSSTLITGKNLEMDLIKIYVEMGFIGLTVFVMFYWQICPKNLFSISFYSGVFINLLFSHSLKSCYTWGLIFILFLTMNSMNDHDNGILNHRLVLFIKPRKNGEANGK